MHITILAPGPSMSQGLADSLRADNCIAVTVTYQLAPWAWGLCAQDHSWWRKYSDAMLFAGRKFTTNRIDGVEKVDSNYVQRQSSSGVLGLEVARRQCLELNIAEVHLHGFDNRGSHYFGPYPAPLNNTHPGRFDFFAQQLEALGKEMQKEGIKVLNKTPNSALRCFLRE